MESITLEELCREVSSIGERRTVITFHSIGDTDSVAAAVGLQQVLKNATIASPDFITSNSRRILDGLGLGHSMISKEFDGTAETIILVDVNNLDDCGAFGSAISESSARLLVIDHHYGPEIRRGNARVFNDESYNSASSIVYEVMKRLGARIDPRAAKLIAIGIISDSAELRNSFSQTFAQLGELMRIGDTDYSSLTRELRHMAPIEDRKRFIGDLFNSRIIEENGMVLLCGHAGIHANKIADDAIRIGADAALFYTERKGEVSFSARLRPPLDREKGINLGAAMKALAEIIAGHGGGHPCAAGAYGPGVDGKERFIEAFMRKLSGGKQ